MTKLSVIALLVLISILTAIFTWNVDSNEFIFVHDEFLLISKQEVATAFLIKNSVNLGVSNTATLLITFFERVFYKIMFETDLSLVNIQRVSYFLKLILLILLPLAGFRKLVTNVLKKSFDNRSAIVSLWYSFNPFTLVYWHTNGFTLTGLICYALAPLGFYYLYRALFTKISVIESVKAVIVVFFMVFAFYFFAVFVMLFSLFALLKVSFDQNVRIIDLLKRILLLTLLFFPFVFLFLLIPYDTIFNAGQTINATGGETYGLLQGGLLYPLFLWFSWGIYTYWEPKNMFHFYEYIQSPLYILSSIGIYMVILIAALRKKLEKETLIILVVFASILFLVKAVQPPFGELYAYLINNVPVFRVFRSPDSKLGFGIVFCISLALSYVAQKYSKKLFVPLIAGIIIIQVGPLFSGEAIKGKAVKSTGYVDRIVSIPSSYGDLAQFMVKERTSSYILPLPSSEFGYFSFENEYYLGQDLLSKTLTTPMLYFSEYSGLNIGAFQKLKTFFETNSISELDTLPIKYYLIRNDFFNFNVSRKAVKAVETSFTQVFQNASFTLYENPGAPPVVVGDGVIFKALSPVYYKINVANVEAPTSLKLFQNYDNNWVLLGVPYAELSECVTVLDAPKYKTRECIAAPENPSASTFIMLLLRSFTEGTRSSKYVNYANAWDISQSLNNGEPGMSYILFNRLQGYFYLSTFVAFTYLVILLTAVVYAEVKKKNNNV